MRICECCGTWLEPTAIDRSTDPARFVCPVCGRHETLVRYPLWWIAGSSGAGKSALMPHLRRALPEYVVFEGEAIDFWRFADADGDYAALYDQWLKVAYEIARGERLVVFIATAYPVQLARCPFGNYFAPLHYLGLVCSEGVQRERLLARPAWREAGTPEFIARSCNFTRGLERLAAAEPDAVTLHDTTEHTPAESAATIAAWVRRIGSRTP
jgi:hypothetical protein